jgi:hypothetical protein
MKIRREGWVFYVEKPTLKIKRAEKGKPKGFFQSIIDIGKKAYVWEEKEEKKYEKMAESIQKQQRRAIERQIAQNIKKMKEKEKLKKIL